MGSFDSVLLFFFCFSGVSTLPHHGTGLKTPIDMDNVSRYSLSNLNPSESPQVTCVPGPISTDSSLRNRRYRHCKPPPSRGPTPPSTPPTPSTPSTTPIFSRRPRTTASIYCLSNLYNIDYHSAIKYLYSRCFPRSVAAISLSGMAERRGQEYALVSQFSRCHHTKRRKTWSAILKFTALNSEIELCEDLLEFSAFFRGKVGWISHCAGNPLSSPELNQLFSPSKVRSTPPSAANSSSQDTDRGQNKTMPTIRKTKVAEMHPHHHGSPQE